MMEIIELISNIKDEKEKINVSNELIKIYKYKIDILKGNFDSHEIDTFISNMVNKYRKKIEVADYYTATDGDHLFMNQYDNLTLIEKIIYDYVIRKVLLNDINE